MYEPKPIDTSDVVLSEEILSLTEKIAENVHDGVEQNFHNVKHVMIHVNPKDYDPRSETVNGDDLI